ncbi:hypothetical protein HZA99_04900 [Candidatus Woesearchaeota archaeon]|nr:hypothetical protein [Candidatus Woesearchaeota archaeon]
MKTLEQLLTVGRYAGLGLVLACTANTGDKNNINDSGSESCVAWEQTFSRNDGNDYINSVQQTTDGGYVLAGFTNSSGSSGDGLLVKTDENGNKKWEQTFSRNDYNDFIYSVQQTIDGGYVLAGHTEFPYGEGMDDGWLVKTDTDGNKQWEQTFGFGGYSGDFIYSVQQTTDGGYVLAGDTENDGWLVKTDSDGNKQWEQTFGEREEDLIYSVQQTVDGGYVLAGDTQSSGAGRNDAWLIKTDTDGNKQWEQTFGGSENDSISSFQQTINGGYVLVGYTNSDNTNTDGWLVKTDADGNKQWEQTFGSNHLSSVVQASDGGYVLAGSTNSDGLLIKTDKNGNKQWEQTFGGSEDDLLSSLQQTTDGGYILAGYTTTSSYEVYGLLLKACDK